MPKQFTKALWWSLVLGAFGCASLPTPEPGELPLDRSAVSTEAADAEQVAAAGIVPIPDLQPGSQALFDRALALLRAGDTAAAEVLFSELTQSQPELAGPWVNLGHIHLQHGKPEAAQTSFEQALRANPFNCDAHNQLGVMARRDGRFTDAETHYLDCLQADPGYGRARLNLGILYELYMGRLGEALATYHDYQANLIEPDARVNGWVMDLERRVAAIAKR